MTSPDRRRGRADGGPVPVAPVATARLEVALTPPQAVASTTAVWWRPEEDVGLPGLVLAPGAGSTIDHPMLRAVGQGLAERGLPAMAFNFGYAETGRRRPDPPARLESAYRDACVRARDLFGDRSLVIGGRSMGGRIASHLAAAGEPCAGCAFLGYPLHPAGRPERLRTDHWPRLAVPVLFVTGERDALCDLSLLERERRKLARAPGTVHVVRGADHGFSVRRKDGRTREVVWGEVVDAVARWVTALPRIEQAT